MTMDYEMDKELADLASELFYTFARFEYALKASGFHKGEGDAQPDWRSFAEEVADLFETSQDEEFKRSVLYMVEHPPNKQIVKNGELDWDLSVPKTDLLSDHILIYVRRVRNNLFHGGKFNGRWFAPQRSAELLSHSLTILRACLNASDRVNEAYNSH